MRKRLRNGTAYSDFVTIKIINKQIVRNEKDGIMLSKLRKNN